MEEQIIRLKTPLTAENVRAIASRCLFTDDEIDGHDEAPEGALIVDGIIRRYAFHPERLASSKPEIADMLDCLDDAFKTDGGGGMSFLNACMTKDGTHWGEHPSMGLLFALGMAAGLASYTLPREMWGILPGGMPYITVNSEGLAARETL